MIFDSIYPSILRRWKATCQSTPVVNQCDLIAISSDTSFFASLLHAAAPQGWTVRWARSITGAAELLAKQTAPIIVYDSGSAAGDWIVSIDRLMAASEDPCIVMAAGLVSEELWQEALSRRVYDVVDRVGDYSRLVATLQFARKWRVDRRDHHMRVTGRGKTHRASLQTTHRSVGRNSHNPFTT
jgi:DNA-binding NtrC family response regulator